MTEEDKGTEAQGEETLSEQEQAQESVSEAPGEEATAESAPEAPAETAEADAAGAPGSADGEDAGDKPDRPEPLTISDAMPDERLLDPDKLVLTRAESGTPRLEIADQCCYIGFRATRLFPISRRHDYISIADMDGAEVGIIQSLRRLPKPMRRIVLEEIRHRYFVPQITYVHSLKDEFGILYWDVDTTRGRREFVVREVRENVREFAGGRLQITDVDGNYFEIANVDTLPGRGVAELYRLM